MGTVGLGAPGPPVPGNLWSALYQITSRGAPCMVKGIKINSFSKRCGSQGCARDYSAAVANWPCMRSRSHPPTVDMHQA